MQAILSFFAPTLTLIAAQGVSFVFFYVVFEYAELIGRGFELLKPVDRWLREKGQSLWKWITKRDERVSRIIDAIALVFFLFGVFTLGSNVDELASLAPELISTSIAIAVLDRLFNYRSEQREMWRVISQMGATDSNDVALAALAVARAEGWLEDGTLKGALLIMANLKGAYLCGAHLERALLVLANLEGADLNEAHLEGAALSGANLEGADLHLAYLEGANLTDAHLERADLRGANLEGADLRDAHLEGADLFLANLEGANLTDANLEGANLTDANLEGGKYTEETVWPDGFDFRSAGAILVDRYGTPIDEE